MQGEVDARTPWDKDKGRRVTSSHLAEGATKPQTPNPKPQTPNPEKEAFLCRRRSARSERREPDQ